MAPDREYHLYYGHTKLPLALPEGLHVEVLEPHEVAAAPDPLLAINAALDAPLGDVCLDALGDVRTVAIAINDKTRPVPHHLILPPLLKRLRASGISPQAITLIIATGTHIPTPADAFVQVVPVDILTRYPVISHDCDAEDLVHLGATERGTPVWVNRRFAEADFRIVVGNIEPHHFAGFSGGVKSASIGLTGRKTIAANHRFLVDARSSLARYDDNPLRQDIEDIGRLARVDFALNVVMNRHKRIVDAFAGDPASVMRAAIAVVRKIYEVPVSAPFDLMITSPGGYPKDINLYQSHKAVSPAFNVIKGDGTIILVAACEEGVGSTGYETWMAQGFSSHQAVLEQFKREPFRVGPHKAFLFARHAVGVRKLWVVSEIAPERVRKLLLSPAASLAQALAETLPTLPSGARVGILPYANATIPVFEG